MINNFKKLIIVLLIILVTVSQVLFLPATTIVYANEKQLNEVSLLDDFFAQEKVIRTNMKFLGTKVISVGNNPEEKEEVLKLLRSNLVNVNGEIQKLQKQYSSYYESDTVDARNTLAAIVILGYYSNAINELIGYVKTNNNVEKYEYLNRYFFNIVIAKTTADWLETLVK